MSETRVGESSAAPNNSKNFDDGLLSVNTKQAQPIKATPNILQSRSDRFSSKTKPSNITNSTAVTKK